MQRREWNRFDNSWNELTKKDFDSRFYKWRGEGLPIPEKIELIDIVNVCLTMDLKCKLTYPNKEIIAIINPDEFVDAQNWTCQSLSIKKIIKEVNTNEKIQIWSKIKAWSVSLGATITLSFNIISKLDLKSIKKNKLGGISIPRPTVRFETDKEKRIYNDLKDKIAADDNINSFQEFVIESAKKYLAGKIKFQPEDYLCIVINVFDLEIYDELSYEAQYVFDIITKDLNLQV